MSPVGTFSPYGLLCTEQFIAVSDRQNGYVALSDYEGTFLVRFEGLHSPAGMAFCNGKLYVITEAGIEQIDTVSQERQGVVIFAPVPNAITGTEDGLAAAYDEQIVYYSTDDFHERGSVQTGCKVTAMAVLSDRIWCLNANNAVLFCIENGACQKPEDVALEIPSAIATGKYGDGCGGGRLFMVDRNMVKVYNPDDGNVMTLVEELHGPSAIDKKGCSLYVADSDRVYRFNLSEMKGETFL